MSDFKLPPLNQEDVKVIDWTPDEDLPLRILRTYRATCDTVWVTDGLTQQQSVIYDLMNAHQAERAVILDKAIKILEEKLC